MKEVEEKCLAVRSMCNSLTEKKLDESKFKAKMGKIDKSSGQIKVLLENTINHFKTIENFIEKYMPIKIQNQISDTLKYVLDKKIQKKLDHYQKKKFSTFHSQILDDTGEP